MDLERTRTALLGGWKLQQWEIGFGGGRPPAQPFGAAPTGLLVYAADGWMNASIAVADRKPLSAPSVRQAPVEEQCAAFASYFNYAGPFTLRFLEGAPHVVHHVQFSLNPNFVGSEQVRRITFAGADQLTLSANEDTGGVVRHHRLVWHRAGH